MSAMKASAQAHQVMHYYESCKLLAYPDPGSKLFKALQAARIDPYNYPAPLPAFAHLSGAPWTIGWGDTGQCQQGDRITQEEADTRFEHRMATEFEPMANRALLRQVSQAEFDGFVSALYNIGPGEAGRRDGLIVLASGRPSTFLRQLNAGDPACWTSLLAWDKAGGQSLLGLRRRRTSEAALGRGATAAEALRLGRAVQ